MDGENNSGPPRCLLHIPKSAGTSIYTALEGALPPGSVSSRRCDTYGFYDFEDFDRLAPDSRALIAVDAKDVEEMRTDSVVVGHFRLATLLKLAPPSSIATVLREPRTRLLSLYSFARTSPSLTAMWRPYPDERSSGVHAKRSLNDYLSEPLVAYDTDNVVCRLLLDGDPRIRPMEFIASTDIEAIAAAASDKLRMLGFVGFLEQEERMWADLAQFFELPLTRVQNNVSSPMQEPTSGALDSPGPITARTLELLEARSAADTILYDAALETAGHTRSEPRRLRDAAFAEQLVRFGELSALALAQGQLELTERALARQREWLEAIQASASWRVTAPLRAAKRLTRITRR
jgi:hypothetical protein